MAILLTVVLSRLMHAADLEPSGLVVIESIAAGLVIGSGRYTLTEKAGIIGTTSGLQELPWTDVPMLPDPGSSFENAFDLVPLAAGHIEAWSEFYKSSFYIGNSVGRGSFGEVWRGIALDEFNTQVVLKRIFRYRGSPAVSSAMREVMFGEMFDQSAAHLSRFVTHFVDHGDLWLVFRDEGISLYQAIFHPTVIGQLSLMTRSKFWREIRAKPNLMTDIMRQVFEGLAQLHSAKVTHRDIKLENILIDPSSFRVRIADFGSALITDESIERLLLLFPPDGPTMDEETRRYAAPESIPDGLLIRRASFDMWCAGLVWLELFFGSIDIREDLCVGCSLEKFGRAVQRGDPLKVGIPDKEVLGLIWRMLAASPADRPTAAAVLESTLFAGETRVAQLTACSGKKRVKKISLATADSQGGRSQMEDMWIGQYVGASFLACVMDGHNGRAVAEFLASRLPDLVESVQSFVDPSQVLPVVHMSLDRELARMDEVDAMTGSTLVCALLTADGRIFVSNVGDSRLVLVEHGDWAPAPGGWGGWTDTAGTQWQGTVDEVKGENVVVVPDGLAHRKKVVRNPVPIGPPVVGVQVTVDHKPDNPLELEYIQSVGGHVTLEGGAARVNGVLAVSRSIGAFGMKPYVRSEPSFFFLDAPDKVSRTLILATDGVWDVLSVQAVAELADPTLIVGTATSKGAKDNMAVLAITVEYDYENVC